VDDSRVDSLLFDTHKSQIFQNIFCEDIRNVVEETEDKFAKGDGKSLAKRSGDKSEPAVRPRT